ncbi:ABC transporter permease [Allorhodopirellula solitaria]|uniref:ABC-2 family transporter protein n=1 Tax=Allorhodopirellula solitaria TaxID=2527987 RepID=A0A5C5XQ22_9BACT|nr:ABC transporter permease [Allorhodopirellula solitaria]TWT64738.1 ABC-2 family transporter protein [Allorhodopirellula solitaria]
MNTSASMSRRLLWKETRQAIPLVVTIVGLAVLLIVWRASWQLGFDSVDPYVYKVIACIPPILFSLGAGTVLVGQEKESRSLNWLNSLPVPPNYLIRHQFLFALSLLAILWLAAFLVFCAVAALANQPLLRNWNETTVMLFVVLNSLYLLVCGFTMSWLSPSPLMGLVSVLPLAVLPYMAAYAWQYVLNTFDDQIYLPSDPSPGMIATALVLGIVVIGTLGYRIARAQLTGQANRTPSQREQSWKASWQRWTTIADDFFRGDSQTKQQPLSATGTLLWQFRNQNRLIFFSLVAAVAVCAPIAIREILHISEGTNFVLLNSICVVIFVSSPCWFALLTFHGDQVDKRIEFLAERGVSPPRVWWTRQLVPALCVLGFTIVCLVSESIFGKGESLHVLIACGILYAVSQWLSQLIRPVVIVALLAPIASLFACMYGSATHAEMATSAKTVAISLIAIPMLATWLMMRHWMDGRRGWSYWMMHAGLIVVAVAMPAFQYLRVYAFSGGFSSWQKAQLLFEANEFVDGVPASLNIAPSADQDPLLDWRKIKDEEQQQASRLRAVDLESQHRELLASLKTSLKELQRDRKQSVELVSWHLQQCVGRPTSLRMRIETNSANDEQALREYRDWMRTLPDLASAMRNSLQLGTQEAADSLEIFLIAELRNPKNATRIDDETRQAILDVTGATDARWLARRRALIYSARDLYRSNARFGIGEHLGGVQLSTTYRDDRNSYENLVHVRETEHLVKTLLEYIDRARQGNNDYPLDELLEYWDGPSIMYGVGPGGDYYRIDDVRKFANIESGSMPIASQWGAGWEAAPGITSSNDTDLEANR